MTRQEFFNRPSAYFYTEDPRAVAAYCRQEWPGECRHIVEVADQVCRNYFLFDLKQDLERTWVPVEFGEGEIDWEYMPAEDREFTFQFNRHRFFICLGQAYQMTGDETYARHFVRLLMSWMDTQKYTEEKESTTWRSLEAGFRGEFWSKAIWYFKDSPALTDPVMEAFERCLIDHGEYLIRADSPFRSISNWGVIESHGLFEIGIAMTDKRLRQRYTHMALERLEVQAGLQIMGDGTHWEQSPSYHNEVLHCFMDVMALAERNKISVPAAIRNAVVKMAYAILAWKKPDGCQFMNGDSDHVDIRDFLTKAAWLLGDPVLKYGGYPRMDYDTVWDVGIRGAETYNAMKAQRPDFESAALPDSGNYYLRDGWDRRGNLLHFHCGTMGGGHGHSDMLHVDLCINGEDVLTDSGRFTYVNGPNRWEFKDPPAHNTLTVDGQFFTLCSDSWECSKLSAPVKRQHRFEQSCEMVQGGHLGYMDRKGGVFLNRKVIHIKPDIYIVADEMYAGEKHTCCQYWNFSERGQVSLVKGGAQGTEGATAVFHGDSVRARFSFLGPGIRAQVETSRIARDYNRAVERSRIRVETGSQGFACLTTVIQGGAPHGFQPCTVKKIPVKSALKGTVYPDSMAEALSLKGGGRDYVVILCHQEIISPADMAEAGGCMGLGSAIVFDRTRETLKGTVLDY